MPTWNFEAALTGHRAAWLQEPREPFDPREYDPDEDRAVMESLLARFPEAWKAVQA